METSERPGQFSCMNFNESRCSRSGCTGRSKRRRASLRTREMVGEQSHDDDDGLMGSSRAA